MPGNLGTALRMSVGNDHSCAIKSDSTVRCWGGAASVPYNLGAVGVSNDGDRLPHSVESVISSIHPNPSRGRVSIGYDLPTASKVRVAVYDMLGRCVAVLVDDEQAMGEHEAVWEDDAVPSGVYVVRVQTGERVLARTVTLAR